MLSDKPYVLGMAGTSSSTHLRAANQAVRLLTAQLTELTAGVYRSGLAIVELHNRPFLLLSPIDELADLRFLEVGMVIRRPVLPAVSAAPVGRRLSWSRYQVLL